MNRRALFVCTCIYVSEDQLPDRYGRVCGESTLYKSAVVIFILRIRHQ